MENKTDSNVKKPVKINWLRYLMIVLIFGILGSIFFMKYVFDGLPSLDELENPRTQLASNIYDCNGEIIAQLFRLEKRREVELDSVPRHLVYALISTEDTKFYSHWGVNLERFFKAMFKTFLMGKRQGGSTLTQQLAKNLYNFKDENESKFGTLVRKIREWITAVQIEKNYTKNEILEMYLNTSYLGRGAYGISTAAKAYFNKNVSELTVLESALLVGLFNLPNRYDPAKNYDLAFKKRNQILYNMVEEDYLNESEFERLKMQPIQLYEYKEYEGVGNSIAPHFAEYVRRKLENERSKYNFDPYEDGLSIYTSIDARMQKLANKAVLTHLSEFQPIVDRSWNWNNHKDILNDKLDKAIKSMAVYKQAQNITDKNQIYNAYSNNKEFVDSLKHLWTRVEVGFVVIDVKTGEVKAMVGGSSMKNGRGLNHVTQILRQPGSSFKPIIYTVALDNGLQPASPILNQPFTHEGWSPRNFESDEYGGYVTLRNAIKKSLNLVSARLVIEGHAELWKIDRLAKNLGIKNDMPLFPSLSLGTGEVRPIELAGAYATFANRGIYHEPYSIKRIEDRNKMVIATYKTQTKEALSEETAYLMTDMLRTVINHGTAIRVRAYHNFTRDCAGKTGTTQDYRNAWFAGYTPQYAAVVWVGFDDERISFGSFGQGSRAALPVWGYFMKEMYDELKLPDERFELPASGDVDYVNYCADAINRGILRPYSSDCGGILTDIARIRTSSNNYEERRDTNIRREKYIYEDSTSHEAFEIK